MSMYSTSVLLQHENEDGTNTTSHTLHWSDAKDHDEAIASAIANAKHLKPHLSVVDVICGNQMTGHSKRIAFDREKESSNY